MLDELHIRSLGVIEDATLRLSPGLTVVTGETGAGKTMLVTALELLTGARADTALVRAHAEAALVELRMAPVPPAAVWDDGDELVVSREIPRDGRSRTRINGRMAPAQELGRILGGVIEVHAQHDHVRLARPDTQRALLDRYAGAPHRRRLHAYAEAYQAWQEARGRLAALDADTRERARTLDRLRFELGEIEDARLDPATDPQLDAMLDMLEHAEEVRVAATQASLALAGDGAGEPVGVATDALRGVALREQRLDSYRERLVAVADELRELSADLRDYAESIEADEAELDRLRSRQSLIRQLQRKYGATIDEILTFAASARRQIADLEHQDADAAGLGAAVDELGAVVDSHADGLTAGRRAAAERLDAAVLAHLHDLGMPHARFAAAVASQDEPGPHGRDQVRFLLAPNPGDFLREVGRAVSGGERSRVALAVEAALADVDDAAVLVFDEVDAGIGGTTAMAVGEKLARLARTGGADGAGRQVLCVTHLAQLAAFADVHHVVEKGVRGGRAVTTTRQVADDEREAELSRMLGGDAARVAGVRHARELLVEARQRAAS